MKAYHIYLLRHGLTQANKEGRYAGRTDAPLSEEGERQLAEMSHLPYPQAGAFFSSPLKRCTRTLRLLYPQAEPVIVPGLAECDFGDFEGKTIDELKDDENYRDWIAKKGMSTPPHGESAQDFQKRCCLAFESVVGTLMRTGEEHAVIMTHGGVIMFVLGAFAYPRRPFYEWLTGNGMGYEAVITPQLWMSGRVMEIAAAIPPEPQGDNLAGLKGMMEDPLGEMGR